MSQSISKEDIQLLTIVPAFVDNSQIWHEQLTYALRLGNEFKAKTQITFETTQGPKTVETTVWSLGDDFIQLKGGIVIALSSIIEVSFY
jgi:hypothetical protein